MPELAACSLRKSSDGQEKQPSPVAGLQQARFASDDYLVGTADQSPKKPSQNGWPSRLPRVRRRLKWTVTVAIGATMFLAAGCGSPTSTTSPVASGTWSRTPTPGTTSQSIESVSCPSSTFCAGVGGPTDSSGTGYGWTYNGSSWSAPSTVDSSATLVTVSCASSSFCVAPDLNGGFTIFNGSSWSTPQSLDLNGIPVAIDCTSDTFCMAVGQENTGLSDGTTDAAAWTFNGSSWDTVDLVEPGAFLSSVSCTSATFCVAVGGEETSAGDSPPSVIATYNGSTWSTPTTLDYNFTLGSVSCSSRRFCVAGAGSPTGQNSPGDVLVYDGSRWSQPLKVDSAPLNGNSVSCPSPSFCMAADVRGYVLTYNGSSWSAPHKVPGASSFVSLTCQSSSFCLATNLGINVFQWRRAHG
jgi:hypothetical protein